MGVGTGGWIRGGAGAAWAGYGGGPWRRAEAAVWAGADDPEDWVFADEVGAVGHSTGAERLGGCLGGAREFGGEVRGRAVPGAGGAPAKEGGEEGEDQGLQGGMQTQLRRNAWGAVAGLALGAGGRAWVHWGNIYHVALGTQGIFAWGGGGVAGGRAWHRSLGGLC